MQGCKCRSWVLWCKEAEKGESERGNTLTGQKGLQLEGYTKNKCSEITTRSRLNPAPAMRGCTLRPCSSSTTSGNGSQMMTLARSVIMKTFRSAPSTAKIAAMNIPESKEFHTVSLGQTPGL
ncbi:hypothetical protein TNCV_4626161 [Trichonephila clavipes]|nr:hypothetical protein TNCV_4626161 [Trichonephila clavipes]